MRSIAIMFASWLPLLAIGLPFGPAHRINGLISGFAAMVLSWGALSNHRARLAAAGVGAWVALSSIVLWSTLLEAVVTVVWGVIIFFWAMFVRNEVAASKTSLLMCQRFEWLWKSRTTADIARWMGRK